MKKILLTAIVALFAVTAASAQDKGNWALGPRMNIYTNTGDAVVGLGAFGRYSFTDNWRIEPSRCCTAAVRSTSASTRSTSSTWAKAGAFIRQWVSRPMTSASGPQA